MNSKLKMNGTIELQAMEYCFNKKEYEIFIDKNYIKIKKVN